MRIITEPVYRNIFEAMVFVSILSLFEFIFFYGMVVPQNTKKINKSIQENAQKVKFNNSSGSSDKLIDLQLLDLIGNLVIQDLNGMINKKINEGIQNEPMRKEVLKFIIEKRLNSYRIVFQLFDQEFKEENIKKFYLTIIIILACFILTILWFIYGHYFYGYTITKQSMLISLPITFMFVATGQLFLTLYIIPKFMIGNDSNVEAEIYNLLRRYQSEFKVINNYLGMVPSLKDNVSNNVSNIANNAPSLS